MPTTPDRLQQAYDRTATERAALPADQLTSIVVDIPTAVTTVLGSLPEIRDQRAAIVAELPTFDLKNLDELEDYALATAQAHAAYLASAAQAPELAKLAEQASQLRETLMTDATALARRSLIDGRRLSEFNGMPGYRNAAIELLGLTTVLRDSWEKIEKKTALDLAELDEARALADQILTAVGARDQAPQVAAAATETRMRAFTLFVRAYDEVRAAIQYLRRKHGDADTIAPSVYAGRTRSKKAPASEPAPATAPAVPHAAPVAPVASGPAGTPDASPFANT